jgi:hypothetical protein
MKSCGFDPYLRSFYLWSALIMAKKYRLQIDFTESAYQDLEELQNSLDAPSKSEVIRDALGVLRWLVDEVHEDHRILVEKKTSTGGDLKEVVFHFLKRPLAKKA